MPFICFTRCSNSSNWHLRTHPTTRTNSLTRTSMPSNGESERRQVGYFLFESDMEPRTHSSPVQESYASLSTSTPLSLFSPSHVLFVVMTFVLALPRQEEILVPVRTHARTKDTPISLTEIRIRRYANMGAAEAPRGSRQRKENIEQRKKKTAGSSRA